MIVRIPVHSVTWRGETPAKYLKLLDQAVDWCTEDCLYVDIDWHSIGNLEEGLFQDPMYTIHPLKGDLSLAPAHAESAVARVKTLRIPDRHRSDNRQHRECERDIILCRRVIW